MNFQTALSQAFAGAVSFDPQILRSYAHDLGEMPWPLLRMINSQPSAVVLARSADEVSRALRLARQYKVPLTPRAQASSGYGGSLPCRGGLLLDLSNFKRILSIDVEKQSVDLEPGVVWEELRQELHKEGLDIRACPTSAPSSTVGGWFAMGGTGIGSLQYGTCLDTVLEIELIDPDGTKRCLSGSAMTPYYQTCGALGIITRLRLACRKAQTSSSVAAWLPNAASAIAFLQAAQASHKLYSASLQCAEYCALQAKAKNHAPDIDRGFLILLNLPQQELDEEAMKRCASQAGGTLLDKALAEAEWEQRYYPMRIKKLGPSLLVGEFFIPYGKFATLYDDLKKKLDCDNFALEAFAVKDGRLAVLIYLLDDASALLYPLRMVKAMIPLQLALRHGGSAYASGMWFAALAASVYGEEKLRLVRRIKKDKDPLDLLNPGKIGGPGLPWLPFVNISRCILLASRLAAPLARKLAYKKSWQNSPKEPFHEL